MCLCDACRVFAGRCTGRQEQITTSTEWWKDFGQAYLNCSERKKDRFDVVMFARCSLAAAQIDRKMNNCLSWMMKLFRSTLPWLKRSFHEFDLYDICKVFTGRSTYRQKDEELPWLNDEIIFVSSLSWLRRSFDKFDPVIVGHWSLEGVLIEKVSTWTEWWISICMYVCPCIFFTFLYFLRMKELRAFFRPWVTFIAVNKKYVDMSNVTTVYVFFVLEV